MVSNNTTSVHLVLAGGGVKSLSYAGTLCELAKHDIDFASVSACSAGTFVGALLCYGLTPSEIVEKIIELPSWAEMAGTPASPIPDFVYGFVPGLLPWHPMFRWPFSRYQKSGFSDTFKKIIGDDPKFGSLSRPLAIAAFDITTQRYLVYTKETHPEMTVSEALDIAVSIPFAYPPQERNGRIVLDAGLASECPVWLAADRPYQHPIVALRPKKNILPSKPKSIEQFYLETIGSITRGLDDYIISKMPRVRLIEIDCKDVQVDQFYMTETERHQLIEYGRDAGITALRRYGEGLGTPNYEREPSFLGDPNEEKARNDNRAMEHGTELMRHFHQNMSKDMPTRVFISYAHQDRDLADDVVHTLSKLVRNANSIWYDRRIELGDEWEPEIIKRIEESKVAILLVSPSLLLSDFIWKREIPALEDLSINKRIEVFVIIIRA